MESILHVLGDCHQATSLWMNEFRMQLQNQFYLVDLS